MIQLEIDPPPSANKLSTPRKSRTGKLFMSSSPQYRAWKQVAAMQVRLAMNAKRCLPIIGNFALKLLIPRLHASSDLDNRIKPILDALQAGGAIANDKNMVLVNASWVVGRGEKVSVNLEEVSL